MGLISFVVLYGYKLELIREVRSIKIIIEKARILITELRKLHIELIIDIRFILERTTIYQNKKYKNVLFFREGEKVYLLQRNIIIRRPNNKLDFKKLGSYKIIK